MLPVPEKVEYFIDFFKSYGAPLKIRLGHSSDDYYNFSEIIGQKPSIAIWSLNLIGLPYIALERQTINGHI